MAIKTTTQIIQDFLDYIQAYRPDADVTSGTVLKDIVIDAVANILGIAYTELDNIRQGYSINYESALNNTQIDDMASNWNLTRKVATAATGSVTFRTTVTSPVTISSGVQVSTIRNSDGTYYSFQTTTSGSTALNSINGFYEVTLPVIAITAGTGSNVAAGTITVQNIAGIISCFNALAIAGGTNEETNAELVIRIQTASQARELGVVPGYMSLVEAISGVIEAIIITPDSTDCIRNIHGNEVDITIRGANYIEQDDVITFDQVDGLTVVLSKHPLYTGLSVIGKVSSNTYTFTEDVEYNLLNDIVTDYRYSNQANDKLIWINGVTNPDNTTPYTIKYTYNKLVGDVQTVVDTEANHLIASDILIREAIPVTIDISLTAKIYSSNTIATAATDIQTVLAAYISSLPMGSIIEQSDLVFYLRTQLSYIDNVILPFTKLCKRGSSGVADIQLTKYEYATTDISSFNITII